MDWCRLKCCIQVMATPHWLIFYKGRLSTSCPVIHGWLARIDVSRSTDLNGLSANVDLRLGWFECAELLLVHGCKKVHRDSGTGVGRKKMEGGRVIE